MKPSLQLFLLLAFTFQAFYCSNFKSSPPSTSNGELLLWTDYSGYFVEVNLTSSNPTTNDTVRMILSLSNNNVLLINNCSNFQVYPCTYYGCTQYPDPISTIFYQNFNATTIPVSAYVNWDNDYWQLQEKALLATTCAKNTYHYVGAGRYGVLGLGTQGSSKNNFLKDKMFSIWINSTVNKDIYQAVNGVLKFGKDEKYANGSIGTLSASDNWIIPMNGHIAISSFDVDFKGSLTFDLYGQSIGFPLKIFQQIVSYIIQSQSMNPITCEDYPLTPDCNYTGYIRDLPNIVISTGQNNVDFTIPPEVYVKGAKSRDDHFDSITLNLKALDPSINDENYVTPDYENTIILDSRTMSRLYLVFDASGSSNKIQVYKANLNPKESPSGPNSSKWIYITLACVAVLVVAGGCGMAIKKRAEKSGEQAKTAQEPLMVGDSSTHYQNSAVSGGSDYQTTNPGYGYVPETSQ